MNNYFDIKVFDGDDGKQYVLYDDVKELLKRIKEVNKWN